MDHPMPCVARRAGRSAWVALAAIVLWPALALLPPSEAAAQRPLIDPGAVALKPGDLPRGFAATDGLTVSEPLRLGQSQDATDTVGVTYRTVLERPRSLENLQSGPVKVSQMISRSDDPGRATFSLDAQREYNLRENGYQQTAEVPVTDDILTLVRRDGPFVEYRVDAVKNSDTLVSTTATGLPSAINLQATLDIAKVSLSRYDEQMGVLAAAQPLRAASAGDPGASVRSLATATPTPAPIPPTSIPTAQQAAPMQPVTPTPQQGAAPAQAAVPPAQAVAAAPPAPKAKLPSHFDQRLGPAWSELMSSTATTKSGQKVPDLMRQIVDKTNVTVAVNTLAPNVGGELRTVASMDGDQAKIIESGITMNTEVMNESPRVLAAMLAHEIVHANQPAFQARSAKPSDCLEAEVEAYTIQAIVWSAFWGDAPRPDLSTWERTDNELASVWRDSGADGLRTLIREETDTDAHSCVG
jgi:hypothetical protein